MTAIMHGFEDGTQPIFGIWSPAYKMPICNLPEDTINVKLKMRNGDLAYCFVRTKQGIRYFFIVKEGGHLKLSYEQKSNIRK